MINVTINELGEIPKIKIAENLTQEQASIIEIAWIQALGRHPDGPLTNRTGGGDGMRNPSEETRQQMVDSHKGKIHGEEQRQKISAALKGRSVHPNTAAATRAARLGSHHSDETKERIRQKLLGRKNGAHSEETRAKISAAQKGKPRAKRPDEEKLKRSENAKLAWASGEGRAARPDFGMSGRKHSPETIAKMKASAAGRVISDEVKIKMSEGQRRRYGTVDS